MGADVNALDSAGNGGLARALLDAKSIVEEPLLPLLPDLEHDIRRVFSLLIADGAVPTGSTPDSETSWAQRFVNEPVGRLLPGEAPPVP